MREGSIHKKCPWLRAIALSPALITAIHAATVSATTLTWDPLQSTTGSDGPGNWDITDNVWSNGSADTNWTNGLSLALFGDNSGPAAAVTLTVPIIVQSITFNNAGSGSYTIAAADPSEILTLSTTPVIAVNAGSGATISAPIASTGVSNGIVFTGAGTLNLSGPNTCVAANDINNGNVTVQSGSSLGSTGNTLTLGPTTGGGADSLTLDTNVTVGAFNAAANTSTLTIAANQTLTVTSDVDIGEVSTATPTSQLTCNGGGNLVVGNNSSNFVVGLADNSVGTDAATIDLSGLSSFTFSNPAKSLTVGSQNRSTGALTLAGNNTISAASVLVASTTTTTQTNGGGTLNLGAVSTTINCTNLNVGFNVPAASLDWLSSTGSLTIAGIGTAGTRTSTIDVGFSQDAGANCTASVLLDGHPINILASTLSLGSNSGSAGTICSLAFDTGTFNVTSIALANRTNGTIAATLTLGSTPSSTGTLIVDSTGGGSFSLDNNQTSLGPSGSTGIFDIKGGAADINCDITAQTTFNGGPIGGSGAIILEGGALNMMGHNIGAPTGSNNVTLTTTSGTLENVNSINGTAGVNMTGTGLLTIDGTNNYTGSTVVSSGTLTLAYTGSIASTTITAAANGTMNINGAIPSTATVNANGNVTFGAGLSAGFMPRTLAALNIGTGATVSLAAPSAIANRTVLSIPTLTFADDTAALDLGSNDMILKNAGPSGYATAVNEIKQGSNTGALGPWTGTGITSSAAAATPALTALAVELNDDGTGTNTPLMTSFDGQTVGDNDVLVKYTFVGDADLSGTVDSNDYVLIDNGFNSQTGPDPLTGWRNGDFNYDGVINGDDYLLIDNAFNSEGTTSYAAAPASPAEMIASDTAQIAQTSVPEPEPVSLMLVTAFGLLSRRRRT